MNLIALIFPSKETVSLTFIFTLPALPCVMPPLPTEPASTVLRNGKLSELDIPNLVEEIEDIGRTEKQAVESNLDVVLMHLLKYKYQPGKRSNSWLLTLFEHRRRLNKYLADSPSLKLYLRSVFADCYDAARKKASIETELPLDTFPTESPFTPEAVLDIDYLPD